MKNILVDLADRMAVFAKWRAQRWLDWSVWWADVAESIETGQSIKEIQEEREREG